MTDVLAQRSAPVLKTQVPPIDNWNLEEMAGDLTLIGNNRLQRDVQVKVYRTSSEHFAVIYPQKKVCLPLGVINLKNTLVERLNEGFVVRQCGFDTQLCALTFHTDSSSLDQWIRAFTSSRTSSLTLHTPPILEEEEED